MTFGSVTGVRASTFLRIAGHSIRPLASTTTEAAKKVQVETGAERIKAVVHCQGSTSFAMSAVAGLVPQVDTIVSNAVSLFPVVPWWSRMELKFAVPSINATNATAPFVSPAWGDKPPSLAAKMIRALVLATRHECNNSVCKMVSFTYGAGFPAL